MLILHEVLYFGDKMRGSLLNPNQLRYAGIRVEEIPRQFDRDSLHEVYLPEADLHLPLRMRGVISYLPTRKPTKDELETCSRFSLTLDEPWEPYSPSFEQQESRFETIENTGHLRSGRIARVQCLVYGDSFVQR